MIGIKKNWSDPETYAIPDAPNRGKKYYIIVFFFDYVKLKEKNMKKDVVIQVFLFLGSGSVFFLLDMTRIAFM